MSSPDDRRALFALAIAALFLLAPVAPPHLAAPARGAPESALPLSADRAAPHPASMGLAASQDQAEQPSSSPNYDEQIGTTFTQDFSSLAFNVTAVAQADANGYGPGYLLNGLTALGYWYQVGISYDWPLSDNSYQPGFGFSYEVFNPNGDSVYPSGGGAGLGMFSGAVRSGDSVLLSLTFTGSSVQMLVKDWDTGASAEANYSSNGSTSFVGQTSNAGNSKGFFTGLMTEWYHVGIYSGSEQEVAYTSQTVTLASAWVWIDEFNSATPSSPLFVDQSPSPIALSDLKLYPYAVGGATLYISAHEFITGMLASTTSSKITLAPATSTTSTENFSAAYTLAGQRQTSTIPTGATTVLEADSGTSITISTSSDSLGYRWVFNGTTGTQVTLEAGTNATYVYYQLAEETVSYGVAGGGTLSASSSVELSYEIPPPTASADASRVASTQELGTAPVEVFAIVGSEVSVNGSVVGEPGERWAPAADSWTVTASDNVPDPIQYYHQYEVEVTYSIVGGGSPPQAPEFASTAFGAAAAFELSTVGTSTLWLDSGSGYSFTSVLNGSAPGERWFDSGDGSSSVVASPNEAIAASYVHQYRADFAVNEASGGEISLVAVPGGSGSIQITQGPVWFDAGGVLNGSAYASDGWQFEAWAGSGTGAYTGTSRSIGFVVTGPLSENATFYVQLAIAADAGTDIAYSYPSGSGTVPAGANETIYVPPSSSVTLKATPSLFVYSFSSWRGTGIANATKTSLGLVVDSPTSVAGTSTYSLLALLGLAAAAAVIIILAASLWARSRRRREWAY